MRNVLAAASISAIALLATCGTSWAQRKAEPGAFDYYLLSLSWSPAHCATPKGQADSDQCGTERKHGFVVHGLWPQSKNGGFPAGCTRDRSVPKAAVDETMPIMPDVGLIVHQWQKHGTCSGLSATDYFARVRAAFAKVTIPDALRTPAAGLSVPATDVERQFIRSNPGMAPEAVAVVCSKRDVTEVRICLDKDLAFMPCGEKVVDRCRRDAALTAGR